MIGRVFAVNPAVINPRKRAWVQPTVVPVVPPVLPTSGLVLKMESSEFDAVGDGTQIDTWTDTSGASHSFTGVGGYKPLVSQTTKLNGHATVRFNPGLYLGRSTFLTGYTGGEYFVVYKLDADPPTGSNWGSVLQANGNDNAAHTYIDSRFYDGFLSSNRTISSASGHRNKINTWQIYNYRNSQATNLGVMRLTEEGLWETANTFNASGILSTLYIGIPQSVGNGIFGNIAGYYMYNRILTDSERTTLLDYCNYTWGVPETLSTEPSYTNVNSFDMEDAGADGSIYSPSLPSGVTLDADYSYQKRVFAGAGVGGSKAIRFPKASEQSGGSMSQFRVWFNVNSSYLTANSMTTAGNTVHYIRVPPLGAFQYSQSGGAYLHGATIWGLTDSLSWITKLGFYSSTKLTFFNSTALILTANDTPCGALLDLTGYLSTGMHKVAVSYRLGANGYFKAVWDDALTLVYRTSVVATATAIFAACAGNTVADNENLDYFGALDNVSFNKPA